MGFLTMMKIGELARASRMSATRIRFYEKIGLLQPAPRGRNGYRRYAPDALVRLEIVEFAQRAGFSIEEMRPLLPPPMSGEWPREELLDALHRKLADVERMQRKLAQAKRQIRSVIASVHDKPDDVACLDNVAPTLARAGTV